MPGWYRVCPQVALPEILKSKDRVAFNRISRKRCDFIIIDSKGYPIIAIEYQGSGHYRGDAKKRDTVKRTALESASAAYVDVFPGYGWDNLKAELNEAIHVANLDK